MERRKEGETSGMAGKSNASGTTIQTGTQKSSSSVVGVTTRKQSLVYILSFVALFMLVALCDWENYTSGNNNNNGRSSFREDSNIGIINDLEGVKSEKLSERLEELREEKKKIEEEIKKTTNDNEEEAET